MVGGVREKAGIGLEECFIEHKELQNNNLGRFKRMKKGGRLTTGGGGLKIAIDVA
jgi:hypothetical protein